LTPPSEKDGQANGVANGINGQQKAGAVAEVKGVTPTTPATTPAAGPTGVSGIVPTLQ